MAFNEKQPSRRSVNTRGTSSRVPSSGADSSAKRSAASSSRRASGERDSAPQYRTRSKAAKPDVKTAVKKAAQGVKNRSSEPAGKRTQKPASRTAPSQRVAAKTNAPQRASKGASGQMPAARTAPTSRVNGVAANNATANGKAVQKPVNSGTSRAVRPSNSNSNLPVKKNTGIQVGRKGISKKPVKSPSGKKAASFSFADFFRQHLKFCMPIAVVIALLLVGGIFDFVSTFGKIHAGVKVQGIEVGGMTKEDAADKLVTELTPALDDARVTIYTSEKRATKDGAQLLYEEEQTDGGPEKANADELAATDMDGDGKSDKWTVTSDTLGARADGTAMAEAAFAVGRQGNIIGDRITSWFGTHDLTAIISFNGDLLNNLTSEIDSACGRQIKDSKISISSGVAKVVKGKDGLLVSEDRLKSLITTCVYGGGPTAFVAPMETQSMHITPATAKRVANQVTEALKDDVVVKYEGEKWVLDEDKLGDMLSQTVLTSEQYLKIGNGTEKKTKIPSKEKDPEFVMPYDTSAGLDEASGYTLQCYVNQEAFTSYLSEILGNKANGGAKNARFDTSSGDKVKIIKSKNGTGPDRNAAAVQLQDMLFGTDEGHTIKLVDTTIVPERTTKDAKAMGIKEKLASWSIGLSGTSSRINNIRLLCKLIDGSIVAPGETWSFNETTGERTEEKGFQAAPVIVGGKHEDQLGGGVCQVATCVFNAVCYSGLGIVTRSNHDFYISTYDDEGFADATVSWDVPDLAWLNDTDNYILLTADASGNDVIVTLWGTDDGRKVKCERGEWKAGEKYKTIKENDDTLPKGVQRVEQTGVNGRSIQIHYLVTSKSGEVLHDITFNSEYIAQNEIIRVGTKVESSGDEDDGDSEDSEDDS